MSIYIIVWLKRLKVRGSRECSISFFSEFFSVFFSLRVCFVFSLAIFVFSVCLIIGDGRIFFFLRA